MSASERRLAAGTVLAAVLGMAALTGAAIAQSQAQRLCAGPAPTHQVDQWNELCARSRRPLLDSLVYP
jgi:hypothetical protein